MFYESPEYQMITEYTDPQNPLIAHVFVFCDECMLLCTSCGTRVKKDGVKGRYLWDYNENKERFERIGLKSQKYICKNPDCRRTFQSGDTLDKASHTKAFDRHLAVSLVTDEIRSLTEYGKMFSLSHTTISDIVCRYAKSLNPHFSPPPTSYVLYLHPFLYRSKKRYYLGAADIYGNRILLDFFGYEDAKKEMLDYFRFHWRNEEYPCAPVEVVTEMDTELFNELEKMFVYPNIAVSPHFLNQWLETFKKDNRDGTFQQICLLINRLKEQLSSSETDDEKIYQLWDKQQKELRDNLDGLWITLERRLDECLSSHLYKNIIFSAVNILIDKYNSAMLPFPVMAARLIYLFHGNTIFAKDGKTIDNKFNFDAKTGVQYRTILPYGSQFNRNNLILPDLESMDHIFDFSNNLEIKFDEKTQKLLTELPF